jgi:K+-sensing histidine kinase KdpD
MSELKRSRYVERAREATRSLFEDLLEANRRLCLALAVLGEERQTEPELENLGDLSAQWVTEQRKLLELYDAADRETKAFEEQVSEVERQNANLASLYAAGHALHASLERDQVLAAIQEIVINLVGSEQFAIVAADDVLTPQALFGVTIARLAGLSARSGIIARAASEGRPLALPRAVADDASGVRVCVPLVVNGRTRAFVLIFGFLPQKSELLPLDHELFALVGSQAATALYAAELFAAQEAADA